MKSYIKTISAAILATCVSTGAAAQNTYSGYFVDGYTYRYQMNPALTDTTNFVAFPGLGNLNVGMRGNLHLNSVLYNVDGKTVLFSHPDVPVSKVMDNIHSNNKIGVDAKIGILSGGFKAWGGYNTISINAVAQANVNVPGTFFSLVKEGVSNETYDISDLSAKVRGYAEIALGHSRDLSKYVPGLRAGATLKFLLGMGALDAQFNKAYLQLGENGWNAITNANIYTSMTGMKYKTKFDDKTGRDYVNGLDMDSFGINGFGMGLDLGASYKLNQDWEFSAALLDLGFISYGSTQLASTQGDRMVETNNYLFNPNDDADNSFSNEWKRLRNDLLELYQLDDLGASGTKTYSLRTTLNLAAQYTFPLYRNLTFGLLNSTRFAGSFSWTQFRLSANVAPVKVFSASANFALGTYGASFGWMINVHPKYFNLFLGMDHTPGKLAKQFVPLNSNLQVNFGINFPF